ncbi:MAG TPA: SDR family oxidoreductase [Solirubrobacteraceae bacterium]
MDLGLDGCAAIVGGASSGMGKATAAALALEGCSVALFARRADALDAAVAEINAACGAERAHAVPGDATVPEDLDRAVDAAVERFGRLDAVVNNTGGPPAAGFDDLADADWQAAFELTVQSALRLTRRALPALRASGRGRIVTLTSSAVKEQSEGLLLTNALRPAVTGWSKDLSRVEARNGITVNCVAPGYCDTDRLKYLYSMEEDPEAARRRDADAIPVGRFATPEEMAAAVTFLCSTQAAYINGVTLLIDGGLARGLLS